MATFYEQTGNTVILKAKLKKSDSDIITPNSVFVTIYNYKMEEIAKLPIGESYMLRTGEHYYSYTLPIEPTKIIYKWEAEVNGMTVTEQHAIYSSFL